MFVLQGLLALNKCIAALKRREVRMKGMLTLWFSIRIPLSTIISAKHTINPFWTTFWYEAFCTSFLIVEICSVRWLEVDTAAQRVSYSFLFHFSRRERWIKMSCLGRLNISYRALGGDNKTTVIVTGSMQAEQSLETLQTLRFGRLTYCSYPFFYTSSDSNIFGLSVCLKSYSIISCRRKMCCRWECGDCQCD